MGHDPSIRHDIAQLAHALIDHIRPPIWFAWADLTKHSF